MRFEGTPRSVTRFLTKAKLRSETVVKGSLELSRVMRGQRVVRQTAQTAWEAASLDLQTRCDPHEADADAAMTPSSEVTADVDSSAPTALAHYQSGAHWVAMRERALDILLSNKLLWALAAFGALLRIILYADNRSLWFDEAALSLNLLERPFGNLLSPLYFDQGAPVGFLMVERLAGTTLGYSEYVLRLFPLVCGLASVVGFVALARRLLTP